MRVMANGITGFGAKQRRACAPVSRRFVSTGQMQSRLGKVNWEAIGTVFRQEDPK